MKKVVASLALFASLVFPVSVFAVPSVVDLNNLFSFKQLKPINGSNVHGFVDLVKNRAGGTRITMLAAGLENGKKYISLYYDNHVCALEPYEADDVIGNYTGNAAGISSIHSLVADDLDEINSVSVRDADSFKLLACANVHP